MSSGARRGVGAGVGVAVGVAAATASSAGVGVERLEPSTFTAMGAVSSMT